MFKKKFRLADVAKEAGVSVATVDRVVHGRPGVKPNTQRLIRDVMERLANRGCETGTGSGKRPGDRSLTFDFILPAGPNTFMQNLEQAALQTPVRSGLSDVATRCHRVTGFDPEALAAAITRIGRKSDGLAVVALDNPVVREAVNALSETGKPVVTLVSDLYSTQRLGYVGVDNRSAGRTAGYLMGRFTGGAGQVVIVAGSLSLNYRDHEEREMGFRNALREQFPDLDIVARVENHDDYQQAYGQIQQLLAERPGLRGIYNIGAGIRGIGGALQEQKLSKQIVFIGHELTGFSRQFLLNGTMDAIIDQNPQNQCRFAIRMLRAFCLDEMLDQQRETTQLHIYVRENLP